VYLVYTTASSPTASSVTIVDVGLTKLASKACSATALELFCNVLASSSIAGHVVAVVHWLTVWLTILTAAAAMVTIDLKTSIFCFTLFSSSEFRTFTRGPPTTVLHAGPTVLTVLGTTQFNLTLLSCVMWTTLAIVGVGSWQVLAVSIFSTNIHAIVYAFITSTRRTVHIVCETNCCFSMNSCVRISCGCVPRSSSTDIHTKNVYESTLLHFFPVVHFYEQLHILKQN